MRRISLPLLSLFILLFLATPALSTTVFTSNFESGSLSGDGWTVVNGTQTNAWVCGTAAANGGTYGGYVSNDGGTTNAYTLSATSTTHIYRDVTFPPGESAITLTFDWRAYGEVISATHYDYMRVYVVPTSTVPVAGTQLTSGQVGAANYDLQSTFTTATVAIPCAYAGTTQRLVFSWRNDSSGGTQPPAALDNISIVTTLPLVAGTYTIDNTQPTGGTNYASFTAAINALNSGTTGNVVFNVIAGQVFAEDPPAISTTCAGGTTVFQKFGTGANPILKPTGGTGASDFGLCIMGTDNVTIDGIDVAINTGSAVEYGFLVKNASATDGAQNCTIKNTKITLNRTNTSSVGILQTTSSSYGGGTTPTAVSGANSGNRYYNFTIENVYVGVYMIAGSSSYPDMACEVGTTGGGTSTIGAATANDIGNGSSRSWGLRATSQSGVRIFGITVRDVGVTSSVAVDGIFVENSQGASEVYGNTIRDLKTSSTSTSSVITGIRIDTNSGGTTKTYNNEIFSLTPPIVGTATTTQVLRGFAVNLGSNTGTVSLYFNSVRLDQGTSLNGSSAAVYVQSGTINLQNNIFANVTGAQATAKHYGVYVNSGTVSTASNNIYYTPNTNGVLGYAGSADRALLEMFAAATSGTAPVDGQEGGSANANPNFTGAADLTFAGATPASGSGVVVPGIGGDITGAARGVPPDIGARETPNGLADASAPVLSNVAVTSGGSPTVSVTVTDNSASGSNAPIRLWYRAGTSGAFTGVDADSKPAGAMNGAYSWSSSLAGLAAGSYQFYIASRDGQGVGLGLWANPIWTSSFPTTGGWSASDPPNYGSNPASFVNVRTFTKTTSLPGGIYLVGSDEAVLKKLTDVANQLNSSTITGDVIFELKSTYDGTTGETLPIIINQLSTSGGNWTVTIRPQAGVGMRTTSGSSSTAVIKLNGADRIILDGREGGTGSTSAWSVTNTSTAGATAAVWIASLGASAGATNNTIRYLNISCGSDQSTSSGAETTGIIMTGSTLSISTGGEDNDGNTIANNVITKARYGIYLRGLVSNLNDNCQVLDNRVGPAALDANRIGYGGIVAVFQNMATVDHNEVRNVGITYSDTASGGDRIGIALGAFGWTPTSLAATNCSITRNRVHDIVEEKTYSAVGIVVAGSGSPSSNVIANNMVYAVRANGTSGDQTVGIGIADGNGDKVVFNSIRLSGDIDPGSTTTASYSACGIRIASTTPSNLTLKDNVVFQDVTSNTSTLHHFAIVAPSTAYAWGTGGCDNNDYYPKTGNAQAVLGGIGTGATYTDVASLAAWRTQFTPQQDGASVSASPPFVATDDLHLLTGTPTALESGGAPIGGVANDYDNESRNILTPDIGMDEGTFQQVLSADIAAIALVDPTNGGTKGVGVAFAPSASFQNVGTADQADIRVRYRIIGPSPDTTVIYADSTNVSLVAGAAPTTVTFASTTISTGGTYTMVARALLGGDQNGANDEITGTFEALSPLAGSYDVGSSQSAPFNTLTAAVARIMQVGASGNVVFNLTDALYTSPAETFPITIGAYEGAGPSATLTIKPSMPGCAITGSSASAIIVLSGADYVVLEGAGSLVGSRDLTITNTSTATTSAVIWMQPSGGTNGATNNLIENLNIVGSGNTQTLFGIGLGGTTIATTSNGSGHHANTIANNAISKTQYGIYTAGASAVAKNNGNTITRNAINALTPNNVTVGGILARFEDGIQITSNQIGEVSRSSGTDFGISLGFQASVNLMTVTTGDEVTNAIITGNKVASIVSPSTTGYSAAGICVSPATSGTNLIANNMVSGVTSPATPSDFTVGIYTLCGPGSTTHLYYNSVSMTGDRGSGASTPSLALAIAGTDPIVDVRDNVLLNTQTTLGGGKSYAIGLSYATYANLTSDNNDLYASGAQGILGIVGGFASGTAQPDLASWRATTGKDANSVSGDPLFMATNDLHIDNGGATTSPTANAGIPISWSPVAGIESDYDGEGRNSVTPDIGADEFTTYLLATSVIGSGSVTRTPDYGSYNPGASVELSAAALPGWQFASWGGDATGSTNPLPITMTGDKAISATFTRIVHVITASAGPGGAIDPSGHVSVNEGDDQTFTITADPHHHIADVQVDGVSVGAVAEYVFEQVAENHTITASFAIDTYTITASAGAGGSIAPIGSVVVNWDATQAFTITADPHYHVADVLVDGVSVGAVAEYTFDHVTDNHTIAASFAIDNYTITASSGSGGSITPNGDVIVDWGGTQAFAIAADPHYHIADVLVDGVSVGAVAEYTFEQVAANHTIAASFAIDTYTIMASAGAGGSITPSGDVVVNWGGTQAFAIMADPHYHIADVQVDGVSVGAIAEYAFDSVAANHTIVASFAIDTYTIAASAGAGGSITPSGDVLVDWDGTQAFAIAADPHYHIADVLVDGVSVGAVAEYTFEHVAANHTIAASFAIDTYTITASAGSGGSITPSGDVAVDWDETRSFAIVADPHYHIADVIVDGYSVGAVAEYVFEHVAANHTITASLAIETYTITATAGSGGSITPSGSVVVEHGQDQAFEIAAAGGYEIADVLVDGASVGPVTTYTFHDVTMNHAIEAIFSIPPHTIQASAGPGGLINPSGAVTVPDGSDQVFTIIPGGCYDVADVIVDGVSMGAIPTYTFTNVVADHTIEASFIQRMQTITASAGPNGSVGPIGSVLVACGEDQAFSITPDPHYHVLDVLVDGGSVGPVSTYTFHGVTSDHSIEATFAIDVNYIAASAGSGGAIDPSGSVAVDYGSDQTFEITPNGGYTVDDVLVDGISVGPVTTYTFTNVVTAHTIAASFEVIGNVVDAGPATGAITLGNPRVHVPVSITRAESSPAIMAFSVVFTISPPLDLPNGRNSITEGGYLLSGGGLTTFLTVDLGGGQYKADGATLGVPCGTTAMTGTLFDIELSSSALGGVGTVTIDSVTLRDCSNQDVASAVGGAASVVVDRTAPQLTVVSPNGSESWYVGSTENITWTATDPEGVASIDLAYSTSGSEPYTMIASGLPGTQTSYAWTIPATPSSTVKVKISAHDIHGNPGEDISDDNFEILYYGIHAFAGPNGSISPSGLIELPYGADQTFSVTPNPCYHISDVTVDGVSVGPVTTYTFTHVEDDHVIRAYFAIDTFTILATAGDHGSITPSGSIDVACGASQSFSIAPETGYHISDVIVDGASIGPVSEYAFTGVSANHTIHAAFAIDTFTITATTGPNGSIDPIGAVLVEFGDNQAFAIQSDVGYHVLDVLVDGGSIGPVTTYTFTNVTANHTIHATFGIDTFTITATAGAHGSIDPSGPVTVEYGSGQAFTIQPDLGYHVLDVLVDGGSIGAVTTYSFTNVTEDHTIHATFAIDTFTIMATAGPNGSIAPSGSVGVDFGGSQSFTITADPHFHIADVLVDGVSVGAPETYEFTNVESNHTIHATFAIDTYVITATAGANGSISPSGAVSVEYGTDRPFSITPDPHYHVSDVLIDGVSIGPMTSYTFTSVTSNHTIHATFAIDVLTITATAGLGGLISPSGAVPVEYGADQTFLISATTGYHITDVLVDGSSVGAVSSFEFLDVISNHTIHASFAIDTFTITATATAGGSIAPSGTVIVNYGSDQAFAVTPNPGHHIEDILVDGVSMGAVPTYTFENVTSDHTIHASFAIDTFTITATAGLGGLISPSGVVIVDWGADQAFSILAGTGYHVADVLVDGSSIGAVATYTFQNVQGHHTIHALFAIDTFIITASAEANGSIDPSGAISVDYGEDQGFTIAANTGYHILDVLVDGGSVGAVVAYTFEDVSSNHTIHARFAIDIFTITATAGPNGSITPSGSIPVEFGQSQSFAMAADPGYHIGDVLVDGSSVGAVTSYEFTNVTADHSIHVTFDENPPVQAIVDLVATQIRTGNGSGETTRIRLTWTPTPSGTVVEVWRANFGGYPEYDDVGGMVPVHSMTYPPGTGWTLTEITESGQTELPGGRDFYYYVAYVKDGYGTWSPASNRTAGTLNYHLGDVSDGFAPGTGNNRVFGEDISLLGSHYGISLPLSDPLNYLDVGPTTTMFIDGRPTTDNYVGFEDLVMFAINYDIVSLAKAVAPANAATVDELIMIAPDRVDGDGMVTVQLMARGTGDLIALSAQLGWDPAVVVPVGYTAGDWISQQAGLVLSARPGSVDAAVMSGDGIVGDGLLATLSFKAITTGDPGFRFDTVDARDRLNHHEEIGVTVQALAPPVTQLGSARPNPVREATTIMFSMAKAGSADLSIFSVDGRKVRSLASGTRIAGSHAVIWDGRDEDGRRVAEGVYYARLHTADGVFTRKVVLLR